MEMFENSSKISFIDAHVQYSWRKVDDASAKSSVRNDVETGHGLVR